MNAALPSAAPTPGKSFAADGSGGTALTDSIADAEEATASGLGFADLLSAADPHATTDTGPGSRPDSKSDVGKHAAPADVGSALAQQVVGESAPPATVAMLQAAAAPAEGAGADVPPGSPAAAAAAEAQGHAQAVHGVAAPVMAADAAPLTSSDKLPGSVTPGMLPVARQTLAGAPRVTSAGVADGATPAASVAVAGVSATAGDRAAALAAGSPAAAATLAAAQTQDGVATPNGRRPPSIERQIGAVAMAASAGTRSPATAAGVQVSASVDTRLPPAAPADALVSGVAAGVDAVPVLTDTTLQRQESSAAQLAAAAVKASAQGDMPAVLQAPPLDDSAPSTGAGRLAPATAELSAPVLSQTAASPPSAGTVAPHAANAPQAFADAVRWSLDGAHRAARIELTPVELGALSIEVEERDGRLAVSVHSPLAATRDLIEALAPRLREHLLADGHADVSVDIGDGDEDPRMAAREQGHGESGSRSPESGSAADGRTASDSADDGANAATALRTEANRVALSSLVAGALASPQSRHLLDAWV